MSGGQRRKFSPEFLPEASLQVFSQHYAIAATPNAMSLAIGRWTNRFDN